MFTLIFGVNVLTNAWVTAAFLALLLTKTIRQTHFFHIQCQSMENNLSGGVSRLVFRLLVLAACLTGITSVLAVLLQLEPVTRSSFTPAFVLLPEQVWQGTNRLVQDDIEVSVILLLLFVLVHLINRLHHWLQDEVRDWEHYNFRTIRIQELDLVTRAQVAQVLIKTLRIARLVLLFITVATCLLVIFSLYTLTSALSQSFAEAVQLAVAGVWEAVKSTLPNLLILLSITLLTRFLLKVMGFFYAAIWKGQIQVNPQHHELVEPTYQLLKLLVIAFALVAAFPYIPGSSSPVFKALSIFVGFLLSLGSTSLASNVVSGIMLTYARGLRVGDRVQVADEIGDVIERTLLVTRIRTIKNVVVSIPNSLVMQKQVLNYSAEAESKGLVLHTSVTIGYDVPWRQIDRLLIQAALKTRSILKHPAPFVLKTSLDDFYITYELNAYTKQAGKMAVIYSNLHENILDEFNQKGVEIMSPSYVAIRDGQETTIPQPRIKQAVSHAASNGAMKQDSSDHN